MVRQVPCRVLWSIGVGAVGWVGFCIQWCRVEALGWVVLGQRATRGVARRFVGLALC
jgi:hypothetical protein